MGSFVCTLEIQEPDKAMLFVFDIENEACLSGIGVPGDFKGQSRRGPPRPVLTAARHVKRNAERKRVGVLTNHADRPEVVPG